MMSPMRDYDLWISQNIPPMEGKTVLITGANSGLGFETAKLLATRGAHVLLAVRSLEKGNAAVAAISEAAPSARLELLPLDLADLASVGQFAEEVRGRHRRLDVLVNNAGVMATPQDSTVDGFEMQFGTNHLGHFALTGLLLPLLTNTAKARVVTVSSGIHVVGRINFDDLQSLNNYSNWRAYAQSKLANLLFTYELERKFHATDTDAISLAVHPGYASTNLQASRPGMPESAVRQAMMRLSNRVMAQSAAMGALSSAYAATSPRVQGAEYIGPDGFLGQRGFPKTSRSSKASHDKDTAAKLWQVSEELTGVKYRF
jgi:NAD(P)-dependent dehydrogenase (short-subunit alcohol dehydrogenase family)